MMNGSQNGGGMNDFDGAGGGAGPSSTPMSNEANSVFVTNLQWWTTDVDLEGVCSVYGPIKAVRFIEDRSCGKSRGMAVVEFAEYPASQACIDNLGGTVINGRPCKVQRQQQRAMGGPGPGGMMGMGMPGRGGMMPGRGGGRGRGGPNMMMGMGGGGPPMDPSMMQGMPPPPWAMGGGGGGMPPPMMMGGMPPRGPPGGGFQPPPPPGGPGYN